MVEILFVRWIIIKKPFSRLKTFFANIRDNLSMEKPNKIVLFINKEFSYEIERKLGDRAFKCSFTNFKFNSGESRTKYLLWRLSKQTGEPMLNMNNIQTEHIMPKNLNQPWEEYLATQTKEDLATIRFKHRIFRDRIGNLTLIRSDWNRFLSRKPFKEKKRIYSKSEILITRALSENADWNFNYIVQRTHQLAERATEVWKWRRLKQLKKK